MFSLNFYPEAPEISNKLDPVPDITRHQLPICLHSCKSLLPWLHLHYNNRTPVTTTFSTPSAMALVAKIQKHVKQTNKQNNTQATWKVTLITTQAACSWPAGLMWLCLGRKLCLYLWKLLGRRSSPFCPSQKTVWKHSWELHQPPLQPKTQAQVDFPVIMRWSQILCTPADQHGLMA